MSWKTLALHAVTALLPIALAYAIVTLHRLILLINRQAEKAKNTAWKELFNLLGSLADTAASVLIHKDQALMSNLYNGVLPSDSDIRRLATEVAARVLDSLPADIEKQLGGKKMVSLLPTVTRAAVHKVIERESFYQKSLKEHTAPPASSSPKTEPSTPANSTKTSK